MMANVLLEAGSLRLEDGRLAFDIRLPWYRGLPLSVIQLDALAIDGAGIPMPAILFRLNGQTRPIAQMADLTGEYWRMQDSLTLIVDRPAVAGAHEVDVTLSFFPPYIHDFRRKTRGTQTMMAA